MCLSVSTSFIKRYKVRLIMSVVITTSNLSVGGTVYQAHVVFQHHSHIVAI